MKVCSYAVTIIFICISLFVPVIAQEKSQCKQEEYLGLNYIRTKLIFRSKVDKSTEEINKQLITDIRKRKVNFILIFNDEKSLKKAGAHNSLIQAIRENLPKEHKGKIILYKKFTDNYAGTSEQKKIAIKAGKEFVERYSEDKCEKEIIDYFKKNLPVLESYLVHINDID